MAMHATAPEDIHSGLPVSEIRIFDLEVGLHRHVSHAVARFERWWWWINTGRWSRIAAALRVMIVPSVRVVDDDRRCHISGPLGFNQLVVFPHGIFDLVHHTHFRVHLLR